MPENSKRTKSKREVLIPCEVYSRIVGYLRPVHNWNDAKRLEFEDRVVYRPTLEHSTDDTAADA